MTSFQRLIGQIVMRGSARRAALVIVALVGLGAASGVARSRFRMPLSRYTAMMVTSDSTAEIAISVAASTGRPTRANSLEPNRAGAMLFPARLAPKNASAGIRIVPSAPIGSRRKIFSSSQVRWSSPRMWLVLSRGSSGR